MSDHPKPTIDPDAVLLGIEVQSSRFGQGAGWEVVAVKPPCDDSPITRHALFFGTESDIANDIARLLHASAVRVWEKSKFGAVPWLKLAEVRHAQG